MLIFYVPVLYLMKQGNVTSDIDAIAIIINYVSGMALFFLGILAIIFGSGAINKEIEDGTIRIALSKSVTRIGYFFGKFTAQGAVFLFALLLTSVVTLGGLAWIGIGIKKIFGDVLLLNVLLLLVMLEFIAMGYIISLFIRSSGTSLGVALAVFFIIYLVIPAYVDYKVYSHEDISPSELQKLHDDYYTKYLFFSPAAQLKVIMDKTVKEVNKSTENGWETKYEYAGLSSAIRERSVNFALIIIMTLAYLGVATWRFLRMDLR